MLPDTIFVFKLRAITVSTSKKDIALSAVCLELKQQHH